MKRCGPTTAATSVTSRPSLNLAHNTTALLCTLPTSTTQQYRHFKTKASKVAIMLMLLIVIAIIITIAISDLHDSSHRSFAFTSAFLDMRNSTVDVCPPLAAI
jgi:ABC-type uncharacterized transport system YnjBCD permease subunit